MTFDTTELDILEEYLKAESIEYKRKDVHDFIKGSCIVYEFEHHQIVVFDEQGNRTWDAIIGTGTYGSESGLLEVRGEEVVRPEDGDRVCGGLTAKQVMDRYHEWLAKKI